MWITPVYNKSLLQKVYEVGPCTVKQLKEAYIEKQPGVYTSQEASFDEHLKQLVDMGLVAMHEDTVSFIKW